MSGDQQGHHKYLKVNGGFDVAKGSESTKCAVLQ